MNGRGKSVECPDCGEFVFQNQPQCGKCGWTNEQAGKISARCNFDLGNVRCPLAATLDRKWCRHHWHPVDREPTDGVRRLLQEISADPARYAASFSSTGKDRLVTRTIDPQWRRQEGESRVDYHTRMQALRDRLMPGLMGAKPQISAEDRTRIQREAEERRIPAIHAHQIEDVADEFEVEVERLVAAGLSVEQAAGAALEAVLQARLQA